MTQTDSEISCGSDVSLCWGAGKSVWPSPQFILDASQSHQCSLAALTVAGPYPLFCSRIVGPSPSLASVLGHPFIFLPCSQTLSLVDIAMLLQHHWTTQLCCVCIMQSLLLSLTISHYSMQAYASNIHNSFFCVIILSLSEASPLNSINASHRLLFIIKTSDLDFRMNQTQDHWRWWGLVLSQQLHLDVNVNGGKKVLQNPRQISANTAPSWVCKKLKVLWSLSIMFLSILYESNIMLNHRVPLALISNHPQMGVMRDKQDFIHDQICW